MGFHLQSAKRVRIGNLPCAADRGSPLDDKACPAPNMPYRDRLGRDRKTWSHHWRCHGHVSMNLKDGDCLAKLDTPSPGFVAMVGKVLASRTNFG